MICGRSLSTYPTAVTATVAACRRLTPSFNSISFSPNHSKRIRIRIRMYSSEVIEHVVLFNVKQGTDASQVSAMVNGLSSLRSLDMVLHLTVGPIHRLHSPPPLNFTHMLHSRYRTKDDLATYTNHPNHLGVVKENVFPICQDIMAVDWLYSHQHPDQLDDPRPGSAMRVQLLKLKDGHGEADKRKVFEVISEAKDKFAHNISFGDNFSPARSKGFSICSIGVFPGGLGQLEDKLQRNIDEIEKEKEKVRDYIDGLIVVDYVLPPPPTNAASASL